MKHGISTSFNRRNHGSDNGTVIRIFTGEFNLGWRRKFEKNIFS
jgi:hypothetical protein